MNVYHGQFLSMMAIGGRQVCVCEYLQVRHGAIKCRITDDILTSVV